MTLLTRPLTGHATMQDGSAPKGNIAFRLSQSIFDVATNQEIKPKWIFAGYNDAGDLKVYGAPSSAFSLYVTKDPLTIYTKDGRPAWYDVIDATSVRDGKTQELDRYSIEIAYGDGSPLALVSIARMQNGSDNYRIRRAIADTPLALVQDGPDLYLTLLPSGVAPGTGNRVTVDALGRAIALETVDYATVSGDIAVETIARENADTALSLALTQASAQFQTASGYPQSILDDTYNEWADPGVNWAGSDQVLRNRWTNATGLTRQFSPPSTAYGRPVLIFSQLASSAGWQFYLTEHGLAPGNVISCAIHLYEPNTGSYQAVLSFRASDGTTVTGSALSSVQAFSTNGENHIVKVENITIPANTVSFFMYPLRTAGTSALTQIWAKWANLGTTVNATPLPASPIINAFAEMLGGRGVAGTLAARLVNVVKADGSGLLENAITPENIIWDGSNTDGNVWPGVQFGDGRRAWLVEPSSQLTIVPDANNTDSGVSLKLSYQFADTISGGKAVWFDKAQIRAGIDGVKVRGDFMAAGGAVFGLNVRYYDKTGTGLLIEYSSGHITATGAKQTITVTAPTAPSDAVYFIAYITRYSSVTSGADTPIYCWSLWGTKGNFIADRPIQSTGAVNRLVAAQASVPSIMWDVFARAIIPAAGTPTVWPDFGGRARGINSGYFTLLAGDATNPYRFGNTIKFDPPSNTFAGWRLWMDEAGGKLGDQIIFKVRGRAHSGQWELAARFFSWTGLTTSVGVGFSQIDGTVIDFDQSDSQGVPYADTVRDFSVQIPVPVPTTAQLDPTSTPAGEPSLGAGPLVLWVYMTRRAPATQGDGAFYIYSRWAGKNTIATNPLEDPNLSYLASLVAPTGTAAAAFPPGLDRYGGLPATTRKIEQLRAGVSGTQLHFNAGPADSWMRIASGNVMVFLQASLIAKYGDAGTGWIDAAGGSGGVQAPLLSDQTVTYSGTVTTHDAAGYGPGNAHAIMGALNSTIAMSSTKQTSEWLLMWRGVASGADFQYSTDGGAAWSSSIVTSGDTLLHSQVVTVSLAAGGIIVKQTSAGAGGVIMLGVRGRNAAATGVLFNCLGNGGTQAGQWATPDQSVKDAFALLNADLSITLFGTNEQANHTAVVDYYTNLGLISDWLHAACPNGDQLLLPPLQNTNETAGGYTAMQLYVNQMRQVAVDKLALGYHVAMLDVYLHAVSFVLATNSGADLTTNSWMQNGFHLGALGTRFYSDLIISRLFPQVNL